jgi:hypothetical protein
METNILNKWPLPEHQMSRSETMVLQLTDASRAAGEPLSSAIRVYIVAFYRSWMLPIEPVR